MGTSVGWTAQEIAAAVRGGGLTPSEVVRDHLEQIDRLDPTVGAFVRVRHAAALAEAAALDRRDDLDRLPLAGVPVAVKDNVAVAGEPTRQGSLATPDTPAEHDHEVVRRLREAGAVVLGTTRMPELGVWPTSEDASGVARNPWNLDRTPGGSSGGSAAAVAAAMVPVAHGNDGMGSIRIPAACCGLVGLKPGTGVVPAGSRAPLWRGLAENGPLATTVEDAAALLAVMAGRPELAAVAPPPDRLTVAVSARVPLPGVRVDPQILTALVGVAAALRRQGHHVVRADPPYSQATANAVVAWYTAAVGDEVRGLDESKLEPRQCRHVRIGRALERLGRVRRTDQQRWQTQAAVSFSGYQVLLTPVTAAPPPAAAGWRDRSWPWNFSAAVRWVPFPVRGTSPGTRP